MLRLNLTKEQQYRSAWTLATIQWFFAACSFLASIYFGLILHDHKQAAFFLVGGFGLLGMSFIPALIIREHKVDNFLCRELDKFEKQQNSKNKNVATE